MKSLFVLSATTPNMQIQRLLERSLEEWDLSSQIKRHYLRTVGKLRPVDINPWCLRRLFQASGVENYSTVGYLRDQAKPRKSFPSHDGMGSVNQVFMLILDNSRK